MNSAVSSVQPGPTRVNLPALDERALRPPLIIAPLRFVWPFLVAAAAGFILHTHLSGYPATLAMYCGIAVIMAVSLTVVNGFAGQFSIGHAGFMAVGGYLAASLVYYGSFKLLGDTDSASFHGGLLSVAPMDMAAASQPSLLHPTLLFGRGDLLFVGAALAGAALSALAGWLVGLPSLRLRGDYLAIVTLGFGEIVRILIQGTPSQLDTTTDPAIGDVSLVRALPHLGGALGFNFAPAYTTVFWVTAAVVLTLIWTIRLKYSSYGRALLSIREDEVAAQAMGVNITRYKVRAFMYGAFFAGIAGALFAMTEGSINAGEMGFQRSFEFVIMVVLGGLGSISGAALAAVILTLLTQVLQDPTSASIWPWGVAGGAVVAVLGALGARSRRWAPPVTVTGLLVTWQVLRWLHMQNRINLNDYRMVIYSLALIVMIIARPSGFFGIQEIWDYLPRSWQFWHADAGKAAA